MAKAQAKLDAGGLTPEEEQRLRAAMESYKARVAASTERPTARGMLGDPRAASGVDAIAQADKALPEREPEPDPEAQKQTQKQVQLQEFVREGQPKVTWSTPGAKYVQGVLEQQAGGALQEAEEFAKEMEVAQALERQANQSLKNLSKDPTLFVPPEHWSEQARFQPGIKDALPGIGHEVWEEPSIQMFRRDMAATLMKAGLDPEKIDEGDPLFYRYADAMWAQRYRRAAEKGESVVRGSMLKGATRTGSFDRAAPGEFAPDGDNFDRYGAIVMDAINAATKFGYGLDYGRSAGLATEAVNTLTGAPDEVITDQRNMRETGWGQAGQVAGLMAPGGIAGGIAARLSGATPKVTGIGANVLRGGGIGLKTGASEVLLQDAIQNLGDVSRGNAPTVSLEQMGSNALGAGALGLGLGAGFSALGEAARAGKNKLLKSSLGKDIANMEAAGIEPGIFTRSESANVKAARQRTADAGLGGDVRSQASRELGQPLARAWRDVDELGAKGELPRLQHQVDEYFRSPDGAQPVPVNNTANAVVDLLESRVSEAGEDLPFMLNMEKFRKVRDQLFETKTVTKSEAARLGEAGWRELPSEAERGMVVIGRPKQLNARELSTVVDQLDDLAGFTGKELTGPKEKAFRIFSAAVRKDRDQFPANRWTRGEGGGQLQLTTSDGETVSGFSALMGRLSEAKRGSSKLLEEAGLSKGAPGIRATVAETVATPKRLSDARQTDRVVADLDEVSPGDEFAYSPTEGSSPASQARRAQAQAHHRHIQDEVLPALDDFPRGVFAIKMFTKGHDTPIRMVQRGMSPEDAGRRYYNAEAADVSQAEFVRRIGIAAENLEEAVRRAPKATHIPTVFRGVNLDEFQVNRILEEGSFNNGGMTSSFSRNPAVAEVFSMGGGHPVLFKVKHKNGVGIETISKLGKSEQEVLLPGSASFRVTDVYRLKPPGPRSRATLVIEAEEMGKSTVGKGPRARSAVKEKLDVEPTEAQSKQLDKLVQGFRQSEGTARGDDAAKELARLAGVEEELKMWAGILSANRVASGREGVGIGGGGIRGWLAGSPAQLAVRSTKTLNRLGAEPIAQAPSTELRALLKRLRGRGGPSGPPAFALMGMGSGGPPVAAAFTDQERDSEGLDPALRAAVMGKEHLRDQGPPLSAEEAGWLQQLADAFWRTMPQQQMQAPQQPQAPQAPIEEYPQ